MDPISMLKVKRLFKLPKTARIYQSMNLEAFHIRFQSYLKLLFMILEDTWGFYLISLTSSASGLPYSVKRLQQFQVDILQPTT